MLSSIDIPGGVFIVRKFGSMLGAYKRIPPLRGPGTDRHQEYSL
jgi:hypothetical protein